MEDIRNFNAEMYQTDKSLADIGVTRFRNFILEIYDRMYVIGSVYA